MQHVDMASDIPIGDGGEAGASFPSRKFAVMIRQSIITGPVPPVSTPSPMGFPNGNGGEAGGTGQEFMLCLIITVNLREENELTAA